MYDAIIIGAGISGVSLAFHLAEAQKKVLVLEQSDHVGGCLRSATSSEDDSFWLEMGAHTSYNSYQAFIELIEKSQGLTALNARKKVPYKVLHKNKLAGVTKPMSWLNAITAVPNIFFAKKEEKTVAEYYGKILGKKNYQNYFSHVFSAVPCQPVDEFPADMLFKKREKRKDILRSFTMKSGLQSVPRSLAHHPNIKLITNATVDSISYTGSVVTATLNSGQVFEAQQLAFATPPDEAQRLMTPHHQALTIALAKIPVAKSEAMGVMVKKKDLSIPEVAGIFAPNGSYYSVVSRDVVEDDRYRGFTFHFKPQHLSDAVKIDTICDVLKIRKDHIVHQFKKENILPSLRLGHKDIVRTIEQESKALPIFFTGNYFDGLSIEDCALRSKEVATQMLYQL
ncbi:protoporphyrinogen/coproporphyrinogen oxidase [Persicobacter psychrovividus]|uniref:FAD-dependent oxidoreductase n=1 Tax=Persicobacter psychrovividus TaxID=387638 RepID=A0ABN6L5V0_9BACT|nr:FAD-dependent oxidoreductase [Persicobacter psychrovividus]